jgi:hypothetical protein
MGRRIDALARRVESDPAFLAAPLGEYARSKGLDDEALARALGCPLESLGPLRLCLRPRPEPAYFRHDVDQIASRFGLRADVLAEAVRRADALGAMRRGPRARAGC